MTKSISVIELRSRLASNEHLHLIDVRQPEEHEEFALANSLLIPLRELPERVGELEALKHEELIIYCRSGNRSNQACMFLELSGFTNVCHVAGGMLAWGKQ